MAAKLTLIFTVLCLFYSLLITDCSFIKPNNVPRVGRSNEGAGPYDPDMAGYVIKTNKNIPRMGRRNYDSENHYDIPKIYSLPMETYGQYRDDQPKYNQEQLNQYSYQLENMEK
ncbi:ecdysis triggering hormone [Aphomia sociella]